MESGPAKNLRKTPGRRATQAEKNLSSPNHSAADKSFSEKYSSGHKNSAKKKKKKRRSTGKKKIVNNDPEKQLKLRNYLHRKDIVDFHDLPVTLRIKKLEEGYLSEPDAITRKDEVKKNLLLLFQQSEKEEKKVDSQETRVITKTQSLSSIDRVGILTTHRKDETARVNAQDSNEQLQATNVLTGNNTSEIGNRHGTNIDNDVIQENLYPIDITTNGKQLETQMPNITIVKEKWHEDKAADNTIGCESMDTVQTSPFDCLAEECNLHVGQLRETVFDPDINKQWKQYISSNFATTTTTTQTTASTTLTNTFSTFATPQQLQLQQMQSINSATMYQPTNANGAATNDISSLYQLMTQVSADVKAGNSNVNQLRTEVNTLRTEVNEK